MQVHLREIRRQAGLSQTELAAAVGVSRQTLAAIEAGRQVPATSLALGLARALRCHVEDLFRLPDPDALEATLMGAPSPSGRVTLARVDGAWAAHPLDDPTQAADGIVRAQAATSERVWVDPLADPVRLEQAAVVAGCAPLLGLLARRLGRHAALDATWLPASSSRALALLAAGSVHVAGLHLAAADDPGGHGPMIHARFPDRAMTIIHLTRWRQGLVVAAHNPLGIRGPADLLRPGLRFARRESGSGAHQLLARQLDRLGATVTLAGPLARGHAEVGRLVTWGVADLGVAIEATALAEGLDFIPLAEERFDLVVPRDRLDHPAVARLLDLLSQPSFRVEAAQLPGYDLSSSGHASEASA